MQLQIKTEQQKLLPTSPWPFTCERQLLLRQRYPSHSLIGFGIACSLVHQAEGEPKPKEQLPKGLLISGVMPFVGVQESLQPGASPIQWRSHDKRMPQQPPLPEEEATLGFQVKQCPASKGCAESVLLPRTVWPRGWVTSWPLTFLKLRQPSFPSPLLGKVKTSNRNFQWDRPPYLSSKKGGSATLDAFA